MFIESQILKKNTAENRLWQQCIIEPAVPSNRNTAPELKTEWSNEAVSISLLRKTRKFGPLMLPKIFTPSLPFQPLAAVSTGISSSFFRCRLLSKLKADRPKAGRRTKSSQEPGGFFLDRPFRMDTISNSSTCSSPPNNVLYIYQKYKS